RAGCAGPLVAALQALDRHAEAFAALEGLVRDTATAGAPELSLSLEADLIASASLQRSRRAWALERLESYRGRLTADTAGGRQLLATIAALDAFSSTCDTPGAALADAAERAVAGGRMLDDGQSTAFYFA